MPLVQIPRVAYPRKYGWLVPGENCSQLGMDLILRADCDIGILEVPNGSNRGTRLDKMAARFGLAAKGNEPGPYWCAIAVACWCADVGLLIPENADGTNYWLPYVKRVGTVKPQAGWIIVYGLEQKGPVVDWGFAHHIGLLARTPEPDIGQNLTLSIEGNRSFAGTASNNGVACDIGPVMRKDILGYIPPEALLAKAA